MPRSIQLSIPKPCHENWDQMTPIEKGRFCNSCQKQVVDFTGMSDAQLASYFKKSRGGVCGHFVQGQLNRHMETPRKPIPFIKYFFRFALPAFLLSAKASAQGEVKILTRGKVVAVHREEKKSSELKSQPDPSPGLKKIQGKVLDEQDAIIAGATIQVKGTSIATVAGMDGMFQLNYEGKENMITLVASCVGYETIELPIDPRDASAIGSIKMRMTAQINGDVVVVAGFVSVKKEKKEIPLMQWVRDSITSKIRIFPNPVPRSASVNIELKKMKSGYAILQLIDRSGNNVYQKEIWVDEKAGVINFEIPTVAAGHYYLKVSNKESGKCYTEKLLIQ